MRSLYLSIKGCSGAITINVTPNSVSGLVVYTVSFSSIPSIGKSTKAPFDLPIQFSCCCLTLAG